MGQKSTRASGIGEAEGLKLVVEAKGSSKQNRKKGNHRRNRECPCNKSPPGISKLLGEERGRGEHKKGGWGKEKMGNTRLSHVWVKGTGKEGRNQGKRIASAQLSLINAQTSESFGKEGGG